MSVESTPTASPTMEEVIEKSIADSQPDPEPTTPPTNAPATTAAAPAAPVATSSTTTPTETASEEWEKEYAGRRDNRIPYSRVQKIVENARKKVAADHDTKVKDYDAKVQAYEARLEEIRKVEQLMSSDPEKFMQLLPSVNPAYARYMQQQAQQAQSAQPAKPADGSMPQPDLDFGNGTLGYSANQMQKLLAYQEGQISKRYAPIEQDWKTKAQIQSAESAVRTQLQEASTWPLFNESKEEIAKAISADKRLSLEAAYRKVVFPKLQASRDSVRADVLNELQKRPASTAVSGVSTKPSQAPVGARTLEQVIEDSIKGVR